ncbi:hypothetical protein M501DRAFT_987883 [Patellaria atrata CBS 101060]|uniref:Grh/CP2 DB domain-containing protein n=1 Tax=Patellaria atrata CBS 101060 TaxID=1346257 RepID=A0A9P4VN62_9PEZI|nr:hypothetical protein M501DRAFT_987883 [Patellaria atrata CBS 101060]
MFRNRTNSQKPTDELYEHFKATFPSLGTRAPVSASQTSTSLTDALDVALHSRTFGDGEDIKDQDPTPKGSSENWRFTPSLLDPNSFAFTSFANQPPGYYTPTPGGTNTLYHSQAGDLHTPGFSMGLGTPLSLPTSEGTLHASQTSTGMPPFHGHAIAPIHFQNPHPFGLHHAQHPPQHHPTFAPHQFTHHQPTAFDPLGHQPEEPTMDNLPADVDMQEHSPVLAFPQQAYGDTMHPPPMRQSLENFRWHVTLNAPTAMIKHADEIPVTYLNKGQAYSVSIIDTAPPPITGIPQKYRTFIRISFEDQEQRARPGACWQLWKEGRGTNEAHQRGGRLQAVEFVDQNQGGGAEVSGRPRIELDSSSFDGFSVTWSPAPGAGAECAVSVRFNFLSTDFSHSKGVKGIPVRLCAKTEILDTQVPGAPEIPAPEICYCKVKLFRDHGAERKLSNDVAHVKKTIDKLKQQIAQAESGMKDFGKRKRSGSIAKPSASTRPGKVPKHKRTWSMSSVGSQGNRPAAEEDLHLKLATFQDMFTSTRPASVLYLRGDELDDPDIHPVRLTGEPASLTKQESTDSGVANTSITWEKQSVQTNQTSSMVSPTPSNQSIQSGGRRSSGFQQPTPFNPPSRMSSNEWRSHAQTATQDLHPPIPEHGPLPSDTPIKLQKRPSEGQGTIPGWIEAVGVDYSYQPPPERVVKPVACFYVQPRITGKIPEDNYYRAVYLMQRTLADFVAGIAQKCNIEPTKVIRTIHITQKGLNILFDDDTVRELPEGMDLTAEFHEITPSSPLKREWDAGPTDVQVDGDVGTIDNVNSSGYELRLLF